MSKIVYLVLSLLFCAFGTMAQHSSPETLVEDVYATISGGVDEARDWDHFRTLFHENARLGQVANNRDGISTMYPMSVEEYIERSGPFLEENGFFEIEIASEQLQFGNMIHVWSTYESRNTLEGPVIMRGINSIQLIKVGDQWKVWTILWQPEQKGIPLK